MFIKGQGRMGSCSSSWGWARHSSAPDRPGLELRPPSPRAPEPPGERGARRFGPCGPGTGFATGVYAATTGGAELGRSLPILTSTAFLDGDGKNTPPQLHVKLLVLCDLFSCAPETLKSSVVLGVVLPPRRRTSGTAERRSWTSSRLLDYKVNMWPIPDDPDDQMNRSWCNLARLGDGDGSSNRPSPAKDEDEL